MFSGYRHQLLSAGFVVFVSLNEEITLPLISTYVFNRKHIYKKAIFCLKKYESCKTMGIKDTSTSSRLFDLIKVFTGCTACPVLCTTALNPLWSSAEYCTVRVVPSGSTSE